MSDIKLANRSTQARDYVWVLFEGYIDCYFYSMMFKDSAVQMRQALNQNRKGGKESIINVLRDTEIAAYSNIIGIVDKDYEWLLGRNVSLPNLFVTDAKDLEIALVNEPSVRQNMASTIPDFAAQYSAALPVARAFGYLHIIADYYSKPWNINISQWKWSRICDRRQIQVGYQNHMNQLLNDELQKKGYASITPTDYNYVVNTLHLDSMSDKQICHGHAMIKTLNLLNRDTSTYDMDRLSIMLVDSCSVEVALNWDCFQHIKQWQEANGYDILND